MNKSDDNSTDSHDFGVTDVECEFQFEDGTYKTEHEEKEYTGGDEVEHVDPFYNEICSNSIEIKCDSKFEESEFETFDRKDLDVHVKIEVQLGKGRHRKLSEFCGMETHDMSKNTLTNHVKTLDKPVLTCLQCLRQSGLLG